MNKKKENRATLIFFSSFLLFDKQEHRVHIIYNFLYSFKGKVTCFFFVSFVFEDIFFFGFNCFDN